MKHALELCPTLFRVGGWMGLGGTPCYPHPFVFIPLTPSSRAATHFTFLREIPIFSRYEMRVSIMSWDNKWVRTLPIPAPSGVPPARA